MKVDGEIRVSDDKESIFSTFKAPNSCLTPLGQKQEIWDVCSTKCHRIMYINFTLCAIDPWPLKDGQVMKVDSEITVSDDNESNFSTLKAPNSCLFLWGMKEKKCPHKQGQSSFLKTQFVLVYEDILVYEDDLCLRTSSPTGECICLVNEMWNFTFCPVFSVQ